MCWVLLSPYPCLPPRTQIPLSASAMHSAPGQKKLPMVLSEVAAQGLAQGMGTTSLGSASPPWHLSSTPGQGMWSPPSPVACSTDWLLSVLTAFCPIVSVPLGQDGFDCIHSQSSAVLFSFHPQCPENVLTAIIRLFLMACCSAQLLGVDCKLTNWLEAFICQLCSEILLLFN